MFFSEEKNQKTFISSAGATIRDLAGIVKGDGNKISLVLAGRAPPFSKKKTLSPIRFRITRSSIKTPDGN